MSDICSANSYQQCSRSIWFGGFFGSHHSHLHVSWVILKASVILYYGKVRALQRWASAWWSLWCCCSQWRGSSKGHNSESVKTST